MADFNGYELLAAAVVEQAVKDYRKALIVLHFFAKVKVKPDEMPKHLITALKHQKSCERFFKDEEAFAVYSDMNGVYIMNIVRKQVADYIKEHNCRQLTQEEWDNRPKEKQQKEDKPKPARSEYQHEQYLKRKAARLSEKQENN